MKKIIFAAMAITAILAASCSKNAETPAPGEANAEGAQVRITLSNELGTRAFFDDAAKAEAWESEITSLTVYAYDQQGNIIVKRKLSGTEITAKSARFSLPNSAAGTTCSFYAVANTDYGDVISTAAMDNLIETITIDEYNGTFAQTAQGRKRTDGFVMTGMASAQLGAAGSSTTIPLTLKRTVAKIAVRAKLSDDFTAKYNGGTVVIENATIAQVASLSNSFYKMSYCPDPRIYSHTQTTEAVAGEYRNMFYAYERISGTPNTTWSSLLLTGYFDADGDNSTTYDRSQVKYLVYLEGNGHGGMSRNSYFRIDATIKGLSGDGVNVDFVVADWETPVTQQTDLGV